jgi:hypothetical protein
VKLTGQNPRPFDRVHGPEYVERASRNEISFYIVPLSCLPAGKDPAAYPAKAGRGTLQHFRKLGRFLQ